MFKLVIILALSTLTLAQDVGTQAGLILFQTVDANGDGRVSKQEVDAFFVLVADGDDRISRHEFDVYMGAIDPIFADHQAHLYDRFDVNGDHHLTQDDFDISFQHNDLDGDGFVTYDELINAPAFPPAQ